jgi:hypothetical protein
MTPWVATRQLARSPRFSTNPYPFFRGERLMLKGLVPLKHKYKQSMKPLLFMVNLVRASAQETKLLRGKAPKNLYVTIPPDLESLSITALVSAYKEMGRIAS